MAARIMQMRERAAEGKGETLVTVRRPPLAISEATTQALKALFQMILYDLFIAVPSI
jgi:hypothetical protein